MSGFKNDIISILRSVGILQKDSTGWIVNESPKKSNDTYELYRTLSDLKYTVIHSEVEDFFNFDYIVLDKHNRDAHSVLLALSKLNTGGILVIEGIPAFRKSYVSMFGNFTATTVKYEDREYLVVHSGIDYGN